MRIVLAIVALLLYGVLRKQSQPPMSDLMKWHLELCKEDK